jgi:hypothetical protein
MFVGIGLRHFLYNIIITLGRHFFHMFVCIGLRQTDTNEYVKETSAHNADVIIPEVPKTDTNEHVKETSAQNVDAIIPKCLRPIQTNM